MENRSLSPGDSFLSGHEHTYERIVLNDFPYFVDGLGGDSRYSFSTPVSGSVVRYSSDYGAMRVEATDTSITFQFITQAGTVVDAYSLFNGSPLRISFQPLSSSIAEGYMMSDNLGFGTRGNFGWR